MTSEDIKLISELNKLPSDYWDFTEEDTKEYTHGLHNYPAMMVCPISRNIIKIVRSIQPVTALLDPFAGSGTVLVEGMLSGIPTITGNDINPLALLLTKVKTTPVNDALLQTTCAELLENIRIRRDEIIEALENVDSYMSDILGLDLSDKKGWGEEAPKYLNPYVSEHRLNLPVPEFKNIGYWFRPRVILELAVIKSEIEKIADKDIRDFIFVAMSESIRLVSNRRNGEFKMFRMPVKKVLEFHPDVYAEFSNILLRNIQKMADFNRALEKNTIHSHVSIHNNNVSSLESIPENTYDLIITSPPYGDSRTTVAYGEYSRLSLQWINPSNLDDREIMKLDKTLMGGKKYRDGFEFDLPSATLQEALAKIEKEDIKRAGDVYSFYEDLDLAIKNVAQKTKSGGYQFWVVGNRTVKNVLMQTHIIISEIARNYGLVTVHTVGRNIPNKVMPLSNSPSNEAGKKVATMTMEHIVVLRKL